MKKALLIFSILLFSHFSFAGNGGGIGLQNVAFHPQGNSSGVDQQSYAIRILEIQENGISVELELNGKSEKTFLDDELLNQAKSILIEALEMSYTRPGAWVEI